MISFIVPVYNGERYLRECMDSILRQSYRELEIILINDGSSDHSQRIIDEYAEKDVRIVAIQQENKGVSSARNLGLDKAVGEYVWFFDCDDILQEDAIDVMYHRAMETKADLVIGNYQYYYDDSGRTENPSIWLSHHIYQDNEKLECTHFDAMPTNKLWKRKVLEENCFRFKQFCLGEDMDFYLRFLVRAQLVSSTDFCTSLYRIYDQSSSRAWTEKLLDVIKAYDSVETYYHECGCEEIYLRTLKCDRLFGYWLRVKCLPRCHNPRLRKQLLSRFLEAEQEVDVSGKLITRNL